MLTRFMIWLCEENWTELEKYVLGPKDHQGYLDLVGGMKRLSSITKWNDDNESWSYLLKA